MARKELSFEDYWALRQCGVRCIFVSGIATNGEWPDNYVECDYDEQETKQLFAADVKNGGKYVIEVE